MKLRHLPLLLAIFLAVPAALHAQATRTWVSGVGDDANPCSRTAPGKTFAGAISKTAAGGVISVLDPGGFGSVTITKAITIDGGGIEGSILGSGTNGVTINAAAGDVVVLRNLTIDGTGTGLIGVRIIAAGVVHVENCTIHGFATGLSFESSSAAPQLFVKNSNIRKCTVNGVVLNPAGANGAGLFANSRVEGCATGFLLQAGSATFDQCAASGNNAPGFDAAAGTKMTVSSCLSSGNTVGLNANGIIYFGDSTIVNNTGLGLNRVTPGAIISLRNNRVGGNNPDGKATSGLPLR